MAQQINLYNPVFLKEKRHFSAATMLQALGIVLAGAIAMYAFEVRQNRALESVLAETDRQLAAQRDQMVRFSKEFSEQGASRALAAELKGARERLQRRHALLEGMKTGVGGDAEGFSRTLDALARHRVNGVWLTGVQVGANHGDLALRGRALESTLVPAYIRSLSRAEPFAGRPVGELRMSAKGEEAAAPQAGDPARYIEFSLSIPSRKGDS